MKPVQIKRIEGKGIEIAWEDGSECFLSNKTLRENCPSALSKQERGDTSHDKPLGGKKGSLKIVTHSAEEQLKLEKISAVGNYAIRLHWGDGHNSGIYSYVYLNELSLSS